MPEFGATYSRLQKSHTCSTGPHKKCWKSMVGCTWSHLNFHNDNFLGTFRYFFQRLWCWGTWVLPNFVRVPKLECYVYWKSFLGRLKNVVANDVERERELPVWYVPKEMLVQWDLLRSGGSWEGRGLYLWVLLLFFSRCRKWEAVFIRLLCGQECYATTTMIIFLWNLDHEWHY